MRCEATTLRESVASSTSRKRHMTDAYDRPAKEALITEYTSRYAPQEPIVEALVEH